MKLAGAGAEGLARQLAQLLRIVGVRLDHQWRQVGLAREAEAVRRRELDEQRVRLAQADARLGACRDSIAAVRRRPFSPFDATGHRAAEERIARMRDQQAQATRSAQDLLRAAEAVRERAEAEWRRLRTRRDTLDEMRRAARKGAAIHREMIQDVSQDDDFAARHRPQVKSPRA